MYELQLYTANVGKLADFQSIFRTQALRLFAKYGIENVFDGTVLEGARIDGPYARNMLVCVRRTKAVRPQIDLGRHSKAMRSGSRH